MQLTEHFGLEELTNSDVAERLGIDNTPSLDTVARLTTLAMGLEKVRAFLGGPLLISSGYRCPALNKAVGGARNSAHLDGYAADFVCPSFGSAFAVARAISRSGIPVDQCISEGSWVHVSFDPRLRGQMLTAHFGGPQGVVYTEGI
jgi:zinc D-Ala-D-Ala carboxypeptidase